MRKQTTVLTGALLAGLMNVAVADPKIEEVDVQLRYEQGMSMDELYRRIQTKAGINCRNDLVLAHQSVRYRRQCEQEFVAAAVKQFALAELTALHENRRAGKARQVADAK